MPDSIVGLEYLPNVHIENINYQAFDAYQKANVTVATYDYEEKTWSSDDKFTGYFSISCFMVWQKQLIEQINSGEVELSRISTGSNVFKLKTSFSGMEKTMVSIRGKTYTKYKKTFSFTIPITIINLSCFSVSMIEIEDLKQNENLDLSYTSNLSYMGSLKSEKIIENNKEMNDSVVFRDPENSLWSGPVHLMDTDFGDAPTVQRYMAGSEHGETPEKTLNLEVVSNLSKIRYYMPIDMSTPEYDLGYSTEREATLPEDDAAVDDAPAPFSLPRVIFNTEIYGTTPSLQNIPTVSSFLHQMEFVEDMNRNVSNSLVVDLASVVLQESPVASIMYKYDKEAFTRIAQATNIKHIDINRYPINISLTANRLGMFSSRPDFSQPTLIAKSHNNRQKVKNKTLFQISPTERISVDPSVLGSNPRTLFYNGKNLSLEMIRNAPRIGKVEQIDLSLDGSLRPITFTDYSIKNAKDGRYKYRMKLSIKDQHLLYCRQLLKNLLNMQNKIQNLYNVLVMKNVFNGDEFDIQFLQEFYSQYNITVNVETGFVEGEFSTRALQDSYLIKGFEFLLEAEKLIGRKPRSPIMVNNLNLFSTDLDRIQQTSHYFGVIINRFKTTYDLSDGESYEKSSSKSRKDRGIIEKIITLKKQYKRELLKPIGINYINMNTKTEGLPVLSMANFDSRTSKEVSKFFPGPISSNTEVLNSIPADIKNALTNIEETKYMNFSPAKIFLANEPVDTTEINVQSFDADFFNTIRIVSSALETEDNSNPENSIEEENIEKYLDSREFLGNTTKFNNIVLNSLRNKPMLLPKIRKKFKFLDNTVLKSKKRDISLKKFDLKLPNNIMAMKLREDAKNVPLQMKALSLLNTPLTNFNLDTIDFDPISNPQTQEVFMQNYLNIGKVHALMGFEKVNGRFMMDKPIYREINLQTHDKLKNMNVLCRVVPQSLDGLGVDHRKYNIHDKVFILNSGNNVQIGEEDVE